LNQFYESSFGNEDMFKNMLFSFWIQYRHEIIYQILDKNRHDMDKDYLFRFKQKMVKCLFKLLWTKNMYNLLDFIKKYRK
jgi:hypothetical protein